MAAVTYYHPRLWPHLQRIAMTSETLDSYTANKILSFPYQDRQHDMLFWITRFLGSNSSIDRTGMFNDFKTSYQPIPDSVGFNKSFGQICLETAANYWKENDYLEVMWSGGIDSTCATLALMETKPASSRLVIKCTEASIAEYPKFYETHKDQCTLMSSDDFFSIDYLNSTQILITGDGGDQLFGADFIVFPDDEMYKNELPWQSMLEWSDPFRQSTLNAHVNAPIRQPFSNSEKNYFIDQMEKHTQACPFKVETVFDMAWWLNFSFKMNYVALRIPIITAERFKHITQINVSKRKGFYLNADFQRWSLTNQTSKIATVSTSYKQPAKDFIYSMNGDADYCANKKKETSTPKLLVDNWFSKYKIDDNANYLITADGKLFSKAMDAPSELLEELFADN